MRVTIFVVSLLLVTPALAQQPDAATRHAARSLGEEANALFAQGKYAEALEKYERADSLVHVPTLGVREARCLVQLGRLVEAYERYLNVMRMHLPDDALPVHHEALQQAAAEREALAPRIPSLVIAIQGVSDGVSISIDGKPVPAALVGEKQVIDPGQHRIEGRQGLQLQTRTVNAEEGQTVRVELSFQPEPAAIAIPAKTTPVTTTAMQTKFSRNTGSTQRTLGVAMAGVGLASVTVGAVSGFVAMGKKADLENQCGPNLDCAPPRWGEADSYNGLRTLSGATLIGGAACLIAGGVLFFTAPRGGERTALAPLLWPGGGKLRFRF